MSLACYQRVVRLEAWCSGTRIPLKLPRALGVVDAVATIALHVSWPAERLAENLVLHYERCLVLQSLYVAGTPCRHFEGGSLVAGVEKQLQLLKTLRCATRQKEAKL